MSIFVREIILWGPQKVQKQASYTTIGQLFHLVALKPNLVPYKTSRGAKRALKVKWQNPETNTPKIMLLKKSRNNTGRA